MSFIRNSILTLFGTVGRVVLSMVSQILISRILGPVGKGLYAFLVQIPTVLVPLSSLGLNYANTYYIARDPENGKEAVRNSAGLALLLGGIMSLAVGLSYLFLRNGYMQAVSPGQMGLIMLVIPFALLNLYWFSVLWGSDRIGRYNIALLIQYIVLAIGVGIAALMHQLSVTSALWIWVAGNLLTAVYMLPAMVRIAGWRLFALESAYLKKTLGYGLKSYAANVMMVINYRLDVFIITGFLPLAQVGIYTTAVTLAEMVGYVGNAVNTALIPKLASGKDKLTFELTPKVTRLTIFLTLLAALGMAALAYPLILLFFGRAYLGSLKPLFWLLPGILGLGGSVILSGDLMSRGKPQYNSISTAISVVLTFILDFTLIPLWGIIGAAIASSLVYSALFGLNFYFYQRESGEKLVNVLILTREDVQEVLQFIRKISLNRLQRGKGGKA